MPEGLAGFPLSPQFPTTSWTLIVNARQQPQSQIVEEALERLCSAYWYPIYAFIRRKGVDAEAARDCTQNFFAILLEKEYLEDFEPVRGKFRAFILASVGHFLANRFDKERTLKRGAGCKFLSLEIQTAEGFYRREPTHSLTPEALFEYRWATNLLDRAMQRLRDDFSGAGFDVLKPFLLGEPLRGESAAAAEQLAVPEGTLRVIIHRLRKRYRETLRMEIAETVADPTEVEGEIRYLIDVLTKKV
jgi:DNA-directed RNA polymerase specialized sigma24 family protein